jgi:hypothetical protein
MSPVQSTVSYLPVADFPGYRVSTAGHVESLWERAMLGMGHCHWVMGKVWRRLAEDVGKEGHRRVTLCAGPVHRRRLVHHLVLEAFVGPRPKGAQCCHDPDRNPANNALSNIRWGTPKENYADAVKHGTSTRGEKNYKAKMTADLVRGLRADHATGKFTFKALGRKYGITAAGAHHIVCRRSWKHV